MNGIKADWASKCLGYPNAKQKDGMSCGVFCLMFAECCTNGLDIPTNKSDNQII